MHKNNKGKGGLKWGVEPICKVLSREAGIAISPSGYYDFKGRIPSRRAVRDGELKAEIVRIWEDDYCCWGAIKIWRELHRRNITAARCTVERLMKEIGLYGAVRGKTKRTTVPNKDTNTEDLVKRNLTAPVPNRLKGS